jgi:hypothetical protein
MGPVRARKGYPDEQILREARRKAKHQNFPARILGIGISVF